RGAWDNSLSAHWVF
nr:immunoglobulin light chain junction region [Macaca mulatta]